jgi:Glycosyl hydrolase family 99
MIATPALAVAPQAAHTSRWTLAHARKVLVDGDFVVTDTSQPDQPSYHLVFSRRQAAALRPSGHGSRGRWRSFTFRGTGHDGYTDTDVAARFTLTTRNGVTGFRGPPADTSQPAFPIRAAFYYAWYPEAWTRDAIFPYSVFHPSLGFYDADQAAVVRRETDAMRFAHLDAGIYSWWGVAGYPHTDERLWRYLAVARTTPFRWAIYYEPEGYGDPSAEQIRTDLEYVRDRYASSPAYLRVNGRFVVFVYGGSCETVERWQRANAGIGAFVVLKAFSGYRDCPVQPDGWHEYSGTRSEYELPGKAFMIAPGFDEVRAGSAFPRDLTQWRASIADMVASNDPWQLVISFNEWPEGTSIESAREWETPSGYGAYVDALHDALP